MMNSKLMYGIVIVLFIALLIFLVFQNQKSRYSCTEDGCKLTPFGNFSSLANCKDSCKNEEVTNVKNNTEIGQNNLDVPDIIGGPQSNLKSTEQTKVDPTPIRPTPGQTKVGPAPIRPTPGQTKVGPAPIRPTPGQTKVGPAPIRPTPGQQNTNNIVKKDKVKKDNINSLYINYNNVNNIKQQIENKKKSNPYFATTRQAKSVLTDYDTFPYPRYFRGNPESSLPIIAEREAGWRPRHDDAYEPKVELELTPDCVMGHPSSEFIKLYKEETYHCYDNDGNQISSYTCDPDDNCFDNDPEKCKN